MQNIGAANADDAFYRYKMPRLQARIEGRGNGIKTNVVNNVDIAKALERPPDYIIKWFGCELGAQTKYDVKTGTSIVNGAHEAGKLSELLEGFIKKYVQCYSCSNPETVMKLKRDNIFLKCKACGAVSEVDMKLKLNTYIIKHPPENKLSKAEKKVKKAEKERLKGLEDNGEGSKKKKKDKEGSKKGAKEEEPDVDEDEEEDEAPAAVQEVEEGEGADVVWMTDTSEAAMKKRAEEQLSAATAALVTMGNAGEAKLQEKAAAEAQAAEEAAEKRKAEAEAERRLAEEAARKLVLQQQQQQEQEDESEEDEEDMVDELRTLASQVSPAKLATVLKRVPVEGGTIGKMKLLYRALFGAPGPGKLSAIVEQHKELLKLHADDATQQMAQLLALEALLTADLPERRKEVPVVLKTLYDNDIIAEEVALAWAGKVGAGRVVGVTPADGKLLRDLVKPFIEWLEEDSDEDGEDEEDDDEDDI